MKSFRQVDGTYQNVITIERSKFICDIKGVESEDEIKEFMESVKKAQPFATHHCYAYILKEDGSVQKFSDDGEPSGTAGMPMLGVLKGKGLTNTVAVITRYFGGIKLGAGGLVRAYSNSVSACLDVAKTVEKFSAREYKIIADYDSYNKVVKFLGNYKTKILSLQYLNNVEIIVAVLDEAKNLEEFLSGMSDLFKGNFDNSKYVDIYCDFKV